MASPGPAEACVVGEKEDDIAPVLLQPFPYPPRPKSAPPQVLSPTPFSISSFPTPCAAWQRPAVGHRAAASVTRESLLLPRLVLYYLLLMPT